MELGAELIFSQAKYSVRSGFLEFILLSFEVGTLQLAQSAIYLYHDNYLDLIM